MTQPKTENGLANPRPTGSDAGADLDSTWAAQPKNETWTILRVLEWTKSHFAEKGLETPRLDAEVLLAHALGKERVMLYAHYDQPLRPEELSRIRDLVARRAQQEPVAYLTKEREFWSLSFETNNKVLIPRPDTEILVEVGLDLVKEVEQPVIVDVGTGCGCVGIALAHELKKARVFGLEISSEACRVAARNVERHHLEERVQIIESDLLDGWPDKADLICANLPYIPSTEVQNLMRDIRDFEPHVALDGGHEGLEVIQRFLPQVVERLNGSGAVAMEAGPDQLPEMAKMLERADFRSIRTHDDLAGRARVVSARAPADPRE